MSAPLASVVINNYNYGRFLGEAIDSALAQTYPNVEVIVVDDGSTDESRDVIASYGDRVDAILTDNRGQPAALNTGFAASRGRVVCFLDADDVLQPRAIELAHVALTAGAAKVHWPLAEVDGTGSPNGCRRPIESLPRGDIFRELVRQGPEVYRYSPTSGNAWARTFLDAVLPLPEIELYRFGGADAYLSTLAPLFGQIEALEEPLTLYRLHGGNNYSALDFERKFAQNLACYDHLCATLADNCRRLGIEADERRWKDESWFHRFVRSRHELTRLVPPNARIVMIDGAQVGDAILPDRHVSPFVERDGVYWGPPDDDHAAIAELDRQRRCGANFVAVLWPAFWWLEYYTEFSDHLRGNWRRLVDNESLVLFDLRS